MTFKKFFYKALLEAKMECPEATQDLALNTRNRNATRDNHAYGPLNPMEPSEEYWESLAEKWSASVEEAKASRCSNCVAFDISPRMKECMPLVDEKVADKEIPEFNQKPEFGYCWMHHFKCFNARSCDTWASGGPIEDDETSYQWQEKNKINEGVLEEGPKDARGKSKFVKKIAKSAGVSYKKAGAIAAAAGRKRMGKKKFNKKAAAGRRKAAKARKAGKKYKG